MSVKEQVENMVQWAINTANSGQYKYSQDSYLRWGRGHFDCSSFVIMAMDNVDGGQFPMIMNGASYTGNMARALIECGFVECNNLPPMRGDILLTHREKGVQHTAIYIGKNTIVHARNSKYGLCCSQYYKFDHQFRHFELIDGKDNNDMRTLRRGTTGADVRTLQILLNFYVDFKIEVDGIFGNDTFCSVCSYQRKHNNDESNPLVINCIVGHATWSKILRGE